jgi:hypothetical protein
VEEEVVAQEASDPAEDKELERMPRLERHLYTPDSLHIAGKCWGCSVFPNPNGTTMCIQLRPRAALPALTR